MNHSKKIWKKTHVDLRVRDHHKSDENDVDLVFDARVVVHVVDL